MIQGMIGMYKDHIYTLYGWNLQIIVLAYSFLSMHIIKWYLITSS